VTKKAFAGFSSQKRDPMNERAGLSVFFSTGVQSDKYCGTITGVMAGRRRDQDI
jgi:hypothetical protein